MTVIYSDIVRKIKEAVPIASAAINRPEATLRELVAVIWDDYLRSNRINLNFQSRNERQLANGRADTVFNRLILEYKKPGVIRENNEKNRKLIDQVKHYIEDLAKEERWKEERLLGVAFDGNYFLFIRKVGRWIEEEPTPVSEESVERFLLTLEKLTTKAALVPDNLIRDFAVGAGSLNYIASKTIKAFYFALTKNVNPRVKVFFDQWALQFAEVHGAIENKKFDAETLFKSYGFKKDEQKNFDFLAFFFALDTYYGLLMKLLAYQVVGFYTFNNIAGLPLTDWEKFNSDSFKDKLAMLEDGGIFRAEPLNIRNFLEGDLLSWYLNDWNEPIEKAIRDIVERLNQYDPETMELVPDETRDILKKLYQFLVPKQIRHDLGEYYTPDWLAERCLNQVGYGVKVQDLLQKRVLDPGCGSGTFLILAIKRAKEHARLKGIDPTETLTQITKNIMGFDLNPMAVISARTNYLLAVADLLKYKKGELTIPVYVCDSINPPQARIADEMTFFEKKEPYEIKTTVGNFLFPHVIVNKKYLNDLATLLEENVKKGTDVQDFLTKVKTKLNLSDEDFAEAELYLEDTYSKLANIEKRGINGIWSRIIKNAFAPHFVGIFDFVVGNPPWVNWESLPEDYRNALLPINHNVYKLFLHSGLAARHGAAKIDLSSLMFYVSADHYLKPDGKLCFVITQTVFKTSGGSKGFRQFYIHPSKTPLHIEQVDDFVELQPFDSATNRTALVSVIKGKKTVYPLPYLYWRKSIKGSIDIDLTFDEVTKITTRSQLYAQPVDPSDELSSWITARKKALTSISRVIGKADYEAHEGANTGGANGVYWIDVQKGNNGKLKISNLFDSGRRKVDAVTMEIEPDFIFPLLRGREIKRWNAKPEHCIIVPQDFNNPKTAFDETLMIKTYPKTYEYFSRMKAALDERKSQVIRDLADAQAFYFIYSVKDYTFAPYKVVWKEQSSELQCAVVSSFNHKVIIPDHKLMLVAFDNESESHYLCSVLNSTPSRFVVASYAINVQLGPHLLDNIKIPKYDQKNEIHRELARLSRQCHEKVAAGISVTDLEEQIDELAAELWGLSTEELKDIKDSLEEIR